MTLSAALDGAIAGLSVASAQISVVSRNIANQGNTSAKSQDLKYCNGERFTNRCIDLAGIKYRAFE